MKALPFSETSETTRPEKTEGHIPEDLHIQKLHIFRPKTSPDVTSGPQSAGRVLVPDYIRL
jgi:hypothetical protein